MTARLLLSCGETSGDLYAGALTRELRAQNPGLTIAGLGGPQFAAAGGRLIEDYRGLAVTGVTEVIGTLSRLAATRRRLVEYARDDRVDAFIAIDYSGFNLRLAQSIKRLGIPVVFYISPQVWAWRAGRLKTIRATAERMLVIFPFEEAIYREAGVPVTFVGHPLIDLLPRVESREEFLSRLGLDASARTVAVLPGSRTSELRRILPDLVAACRLVARRLPGTQFIVARAPNLDDGLFAPALGKDVPLAIVEGQTDTVLAAADLALTASGTATVQTALHGTPMVVVYRLSGLEYAIGRRFVKVDTFAMVNLIAGSRVVPELIQDAFTPEAVADEAVLLLTDTGRAEAMRQNLATVRARLGGPGASRRAAEAISRLLQQRKEQA
ncbi:MAG: lipid-A-disaccharide synthase [Vicinamibacterales bacterium]